MKVKEDANLVRNLKSIVFNIVNELENVEESKAFQVAKWLLSKSHYINKLSNKKFFKVPKDITFGDIVLVDFGINIGEELSDENRNGHFAIVWRQQGFTFLVIPLTSVVQTNNPFAVNIGVIDGLPQKVDSYAKIDYIRWIDKNRIIPIDKQPTGKIVIGSQEKKEGIIKKIKDKLIETLVK